MLRVNQAGEYGAVCIYRGQLKTMTSTQERAIIQDMEAGEQHHLSTFNNLLLEHRVPPTLLSPLWHVGGYIMGMVTGALGSKAAHACTKAVEEVIEEHYFTQIQALEHDSHPLAPSLRETFIKFREEEMEHKNIAHDRGADDAPFAHIISRGVKIISRLAIAASKKI